MFTCRIFITPTSSLLQHKQIVRELLDDLANKFRHFRSIQNADNHFIEFENITKEAVFQFEEFLKEKSLDYDVVVEEKCSAQELKRAVYLPLLIDGEAIDLDFETGQPLNRFSDIICAKCCFPNEQIMPNPYVVSEKNVSKVQDIYNATNGIIVASEKALEIIRECASDCIVFGKINVLESDPIKLMNPYYWVKPVGDLGKECLEQRLQVCDNCGMPIQVQKGETEDKFLAAGICLDSFGPQPLKIARSGSWYGVRTRERPFSVSRAIFISGELYSMIVRQKLKGIVRPTNVVTELNTPT